MKKFLKVSKKKVNENSLKPSFLEGTEQEKLYSNALNATCGDSGET